MSELSPIPWWIFAIRGSRQTIEPLVDTSPSFRFAKYERGDVRFVSGDGWTGVYCYRQEPIPYEIADELVRELSLEVVILDLGEVNAIIHFVEGVWEPTIVPDPSRFADERGLPAPWLYEPGLPSRPFRQATVIRGIGLDQLIELGLTREQLIQGPMGIVILDDVSRVLRDTPRTIVSRYLDNGEFVVNVLDRESLREFPTSMIVGQPPLDSVAGETEPRAIVRALGIPEDWMFPPDDN